MSARWSPATLRIVKGIYLIENSTGASTVKVRADIESVEVGFHPQQGGTVLRALGDAAARLSRDVGPAQ
jgi:hypothetical protein